MELNMVFKILILIFKIYLYIAPIIFLWGVWNDRNFDIKPILNIQWFNNNFIEVGSFLGLVVIFYLGFDRVLSFIPESWSLSNHNEENFVGLRGGMSALSSLLMTTLISKIINKYKTMQLLFQKSKDKLMRNREEGYEENDDYE